MLKAMIIEDEVNASNLLERMLLDINPNILIIDKCRDLPSGVKSIKKNSPDVVFLDIELPVYSGIQLLDFFNEDEINFQIIFTTASNEYALKAFEMSAVDYLVKPLQEEKLKASIEKILKQQNWNGINNLNILKENIRPNSSRKMVVPVANGFEVLSLDEIHYLKAEGSYTQICFEKNRQLLVSKNLKHFETILNGIRNFVRIHRSFIVNINFVKKIFRKEGATLLLENNNELPIAEERMKDLLDALNSI